MRSSLYQIILVFILCQLTSCRKDAEITEQVIQTEKKSSLHIESLVQNLQIPWGLAYLPDSALVFTERNGKINLLKKGEVNYTTLMVRQVQTNGEGGTLGIAADPDFLSNHFLYVYETTDSNRVLRLKFENNVLTEDKTIVRAIPKSPNHNGGALKFGPDGYLYIGTGDALQPPRAQDKNSLSGKILRVDREGASAPGNPFGNKIWTYGHRNVQGFTWTPGGIMLASEHGPSGEFGWCCHDEINLIKGGNNYGWPLALGGTETDTLTPPIAHSGDETWAPSGCSYLSKKTPWGECLVVACLRGQKLIRFYFDANSMLVAASDTLVSEFHRLRNVAETPDGSIIFCTSNLGTINPPIAGDDRILRIFAR